MIRSLLLASIAVAASSAAYAQTPAAPAPAAPAPAAPAAPVSAPPVLSQIVVYDINQLIAQSAAGADMRAKLTAITDQVRRELEPDQRQLQSEITAIRATSVAEAQSPANVQRQENFQRQYQQFQAKQERLAAVLEQTERNALSTFYTAMTPVLRATMLSRNGLIAMQASNVEAYVPGIDITAELVTRLNATTRTIAVTRATLQPQGGAQPAAAAAPGAAPRPATPAVPAAGPLPRQPATTPRAAPPR
jgi:Skp family chaperone for outer membrane proteins